MGTFEHVDDQAKKAEKQSGFSTVLSNGVPGSSVTLKAEQSPPGVSEQASEGRCQRRCANRRYRFRLLWLVFTNAGVSLESSSFPFQPNESLPSNIPMSHLNLSRATFFIVRTSGELKVPAGMHMYCAAAWKAANSAMPRSVHQYESAFVTDLS